MFINEGGIMRKFILISIISFFVIVVSIDRIRESVGNEPVFKGLIGTSYAERQVSHSENSITAIAQGMIAGEEKTFSGVIGDDLEIEMTLSRKGNILSGTYINKKYGKSIDLLGVIDGENHFILNESTDGKDTGSFDGYFQANGELKGRWISAENERFSFNLTEGLLGDNSQGDGSGEKNFTIRRIEASKNEVKIFFSYPSLNSRTEFLSNIMNFIKIYPKTGFAGYALEDKDFVILKGIFKSGQEYKVSIPKDVEVLNHSYIRTVSTFTVKPEPHLEFIDYRDTMERVGRQLIHIKTNVNTLLLQGVRIPPVLLAVAEKINFSNVPWENISNHFNEIIDRIRKSVGNEPPFKGLFGTSYEERQVFHSEKKYKVVPVSLPLTFRKDSQSGAFELVRITDEWTGEKAKLEPRLILTTDLAITYKRSSKDLLVWVTSLNSGTPKANAQIFALNREGSIFVLGKTDSDGVLTYSSREVPGILMDISQLDKKFKYNLPSGYFFSEFKVKKIQEKLPVSEIETLLVADQKDFSFLHLQHKDEFHANHVKFASSLKGITFEHKGKVFTDRGIYRPGEKVHFKGTIRTFSNGQVLPTGGSVNLRVLNSKGEEVYTSDQVLSPFGTASGEMVIKPHFPLGTYTVYIKYVDYSVSHSFQVEEFRPPRHFSRVTFSKRRVIDKSFAEPQPIQVLDILIEGAYFAGGPVKNGQVRWKIFHSGTEFSVKDFGNYLFGNPSEERVLLESSEAILDEMGKLKITFPLDPSILTGLKALDVVATVVDFDGRSASVKNMYQERPEILIGIGKQKSQKLRRGESAILSLMLINQNGTPAKDNSLNLEVFKKSYHYIRKRNRDGEVYWQWTKDWVKQYSSIVPLNEGKGSLDFTPNYSGDHLLVFSYKKEDQIYKSAKVIPVGYASRSDEKKESYQRLDLFSDKEVYKPGESATLTLRPQMPISHYLLTVERGGIKDYRIIPFTGSDQKIEIPLEETHAPNVYVSLLGTVARRDFSMYSNSIDEGAPTFQFGTLELSVLKRSDQLEITIGDETQNLEGAPGSEVTLNLWVKNKEGAPVEAELAVGVVDEKVLALTGYSTPNLDGLSQFTFPLMVQTADLRNALIHQTPLSQVWNEVLTGGGGLERTKVKSTIRKKFNPVAFFDPDFITGPDGKVTIRFTLPDTMTSYRVYAVAADRSNGFASAERQLLAVNEFYIEPGMPRFFTMGDEFKFNVSAFNKTEREGEVGLNVASTEELQLMEVESATHLNEQDSGLLSVRGQAVHAGKATTLFQGSFLNNEDSVQLKIPVNTGNTVDTQVLLGSFEGESNVSFPLPELLQQIKDDEDIVQDLEINLTIATNPFLNISEGLNYMMKYPYGCIEQTSSGVLPLAALRGLIEKGMIPGQSVADVDRFLNSGVNRLFIMQTESGGFGYWPGDRKPHLEGTLYAMAALSIARRNGFPVPIAPFSNALDYLYKTLNNGGYSQHNTAFASYLLALNNDLGNWVINNRISTLSQFESEESFFWVLASSLNKNVLVDNYRSLVKNSFKSHSDFIAQSSYGEFNNRYRSQAIALLAAISYFPGDAPQWWGEKVVHKIANQLIIAMDSRGLWNSTSDTGWALFALGEYFKEYENLGATAKVNFAAGSLPIKGYQINKVGTRITLSGREFLENPTLSFQGDPGQTFYYKALLKYPRVDYAKSGHFSGWKVWKTIENLDGTDIIRIGDIVKVKVRFEAEKDKYNHDYKYFVVDDPLPAGFVAINSAIKTEEQIVKPSGEEKDELYSHEDEAWNFVPNYVEYRDDRVTAFKNNFYWWGTYQFVYYARAITEGEFIIPSSKVQLMYSPDVKGYTPVTKIKILGR